MDSLRLNQNIINQVINISSIAGKAILEIYRKDLDIQIKKDFSPLTQADLVSHEIITSSLKEITPNTPILSEESIDIPFTERVKWNSYWLVDPLDGTKEFINKNGEFTVNIALIKNNKPVFGVIYVPTMKTTFWGSKDFGSFELNENQELKKIESNKHPNENISFLVSRSHLGKEKGILDKVGNYEIIIAGSSLKFCLIASGKADAYLRLGPTCEWDTAAGQAIVENAGGFVLGLNNKSLIYNKKNILNPFFFVSSNNGVKKRILEAL